MLVLEGSARVLRRAGRPPRRFGLLRRASSFCFRTWSSTDRRAIADGREHPRQAARSAHCSRNSSLAISSSAAGQRGDVLDLVRRRSIRPSTIAGLELDRRNVFGEVGQRLGQRHRVLAVEGHGRRTAEVLLERRQRRLLSMAISASVFLTTTYVAAGVAHLVAQLGDLRDGDPLIADQEGVRRLAEAFSMLGDAAALSSRQALLSPYCAPWPRRRSVGRRRP